MQPQLRSFTIFAALVATTHAADWPHWRGPDGDNISKETGLLKSWPRTGPRQLWRAPLGEGYAGVSVVGGKVYTIFDDGPTETAICLNADSGQLMWKYPMGRKYTNNFGNGARTQPTVDGDRVYVFGGHGELACLNAQTGQKIWAGNMLRKYRAKNISWGVSASPVVYNDLLLIMPGGSGNGSLVALNKLTGQEVWATLGDKAGYATPAIANLHGANTALFFTASGLRAVNPSNGGLLWSYPWSTRYDVNAATPIAFDNKVFISSDYGSGCALLAAPRSAGQPTQMYRSKSMKNHFASCILHEGHLYGLNSARLTCIDANSGREKWQTGGYGKGSLTMADGMLYVLSERGTMALIKATPTSYQLVSQVQRLMGSKCWTLPTISNGHLYLRDESQMKCFDISASQ